MKLLQKIVLLVAIGFILTSCVCIAPALHPIKYGKLPIGGEDDEKIVFAENGVGAHVKWRKYIGTPFFHFDNSTWYMLGPNSAILPDGKIYFQDQVCIFVADMATGKVVCRYEKPDGFQWCIADLDEACLEPDKKVFPLESWMGDRHSLLMIDEETKKGKIAGDSPFIFYANDEKIVNVLSTGTFQSLFQFREIYPGKILWHSGKIFAQLHSLQIYPDVTPSGVIVALYGKGDLLVTEARYLNTGLLFWNNLFKVQSTSKDALHGLQKFDQLFVTEFYYNEESNNLDGQVTSLSPLTGNMNWQIPHAVWLYTKKSKDSDNLFYLYKKNQPEVIYGVDQKTGEEKLTLCLKGYHHGHGIIATSKNVFYPSVDGLKHHPLWYNTFNAIDKMTGKTLWTLALGEQKALPHYEDGVLYFGNKFNKLRNYYSGTIRKYQSNFDIHKKGEIPTTLSKTAFAVNADTGETLWKLNLEGSEEAYIERLLVKDNMVFIKSLAGWLYAIEWEKPAS